LLRAIREDTLLRNEKIQKIINLLEQGYTCRQTADLLGVSLATVKKVSCGKRRLNIPKVRSTEPAYVQAEPVPTLKSLFHLADNEYQVSE
jgi:transposase